MATQLQGMGLFGMPTAQEARQQYEQGLMLTPAQMGSQGLLQQVVSTIAQGGAGVGYGLGRMMGGMAPQEAEAMGMQQAMQEVTAMGITDPAKKMTALADALQKRGLSRAAMKALEQGRKMQAEDLAMQKSQGELGILRPVEGYRQAKGSDGKPLTDFDGKPVYEKYIIGYQDYKGNKYSPEQAASLFNAGAKAEGAPPPPPTKKDPAAILEQNAKKPIGGSSAAAAAATQPTITEPSPEDPFYGERATTAPVAAPTFDSSRYLPPLSLETGPPPSRLGTPITAKSRGMPSIYSGTPEEWKKFREKEKKKIADNIKRLKELDEKIRKMGRGEK